MSAVSSVKSLSMRKSKEQTPKTNGHLFKLDIACGNNKQKGFKGIDIIGKGTQADIVHDLNKFPWPFEANSVDEIFCSHYIEHVPDLMAFMNEIGRILKVGSRVMFIAPYYTSIRAWQDPTHVRAISEASFLYYGKEWRKINRLEHYPINCNFKIESINYAFDTEWRDKSADAIQYAMKHFWNVASDIQVILRKL